MKRTSLDLKRTSLMVGLAVTALFGGSMALVFLWTGRPSPSDSPAVPPDAGAPPSETAPVAPPAAPPPRPAPRAGAGPSRAWWKAPGEDPPATPMAGRVIRKSVHKALLAAPVQKRLARCVDSHGGFGGGAAPGLVPRGKPAVLMLELEALGGELRVVEAKVQAWGEASAEAVSCAQNVLRGQIIRASVAERGHRVQMSFPLSPRSEALAVKR